MKKNFLQFDGDGEREKKNVYASIKSHKINEIFLQWRRTGKRGRRNKYSDIYVFLFCVALFSFTSFIKIYFFFGFNYTDTCRVATRDLNGDGH